MVTLPAIKQFIQFSMITGAATRASPAEETDDPGHRDTAFLDGAL